MSEEDKKTHMLWLDFFADSAEMSDRVLEAMLHDIETIRADRKYAKQTDMKLKGMGL